MRALATAISLVAISATAAATDLIEQVQWRGMPLYMMSRSMYDSNPGAMSSRDTLSLSHAHVSVSSLDMDNAVQPQTGTGHLMATAAAESLQHLDSVSTVWGYAEFAYGRLRDIRWSDCIDYDLIAPYVLGDDTGGDLTFRRYDLGGGYSRRIGTKLTVGADLGYRAEIAWRAVDPRVKTIVSDLHISAGASYRLSTGRLAGLSASVRSYSQNCDLEFYNPLNDINTLPLTGLGTYYKRFAGNTNKSSGHSGTGYSLATQWLSLDGSGLQVALHADGMKMSQQLRNFNNITLAYTSTHRYGAEMTYGITLSAKVKMLPCISGTYWRRSGTENLFGTAAGASYDRIGSRKPYLHERMSVSVALPIQISTGSGYLTVKPSAIYCDSRESMSSTTSRVEASWVTTAITIDYSVLTNGSWLLQLNAGYSRHETLSGDCRLTGLDSGSALHDSVLSAYTMLAADSGTVSASVSASRPVGDHVMGLSGGYLHTSYAGALGTSHLITGTLSITF